MEITLQRASRMPEWPHTGTPRAHPVTPLSGRVSGCRCRQSDASCSYLSSIASLSPDPSPLMRRLLSILTPLVAIWALASFVGTMLDPARAGFWTQSLMWSLISCMVVAPFFAFSRNGTSRKTSSGSGRTTAQQPADASEQAEPFDDHSNRTLWPQAEEETDDSVRARA